MRHLPYRMMIHTFTHFRLTTTRDEAGGQVPQYTLGHKDVPCCVIEEYSRLYETYLQRDEEQMVLCHFLKKEVFEDIGMKDRILFQGQNYRVNGKHDVLFDGQYFRLELRREVD